MGVGVAGAGAAAAAVAGAVRPAFGASTSVDEAEPGASTVVWVRTPALVGMPTIFSSSCIAMSANFSYIQFIRMLSCPPPQPPSA